MTTKPTKSSLKTTEEQESKQDISESSEVTSPEAVQEIKVIERIIENREVAPQDVFQQLSRPQIDLMKRTVAKGASDDELKLFLQVCKGSNLNPFLKQVFLVPRWDSKEGKEVRAIQVSIDGFRAIAEESGAYAGNEDPIFGPDKDLELEKKKLTVPQLATVTVYKIVAGQRYPFTATARWDEYYPGPKMGFQWHQRPYLMLGKCAEALALRKAFPKLLSGMYAQEELDKGQESQTTEEKVSKASETLKRMIAVATIEELEDYKEKITKSAKYTTAQKKDFLDLINIRINDIVPA